MFQGEVYFTLWGILKSVLFITLACVASMLRTLHIENFAIIDALHLELAPGLVVLTGETGAGKSILVDALTLVLGGRAHPGMVRQGATRAYIEATFQLSPEMRARLRPLLEEHDLWDPEEAEELVLSREIRRQGRHPARVNGRLVSLQVVRQLATHLVDIHGQAEHLTLLQPRYQRALLDRYAHLEEALEGYQELYRRWQQVQQELATLQERLRTAARQIDLLQYQIQEIEATGLTPGEDQALRQERERLVHAERLARWVQQALQLLDEGTLETPAATDLVGQAAALVEDIARIDATQEPLARQLQDLLEGLSDAARELRRYTEDLEFEPQRLEEIEARLALIDSLKRKYGNTIEEILAYAQRAREELEQLNTADLRLEELQRQLEALTRELVQRALELSQARREAAQRLAQAVEQELAALRMTHARFQVEVQHRYDPQGLELPSGERVAFDRYGIDQVTFLIAPNPGEGLHPLARIASGGEVARIMLALRQALARQDPVPTLIFDEIDQGVGGRIAAVVGQKLRQLARHHQVLCITHLPQIAAYGHQHFKVEKAVRQGRTRTQVRPLQDEERVRELAQMLGDPGPTGLATARTLLEQARHL